MRIARTNYLCNCITFILVLFAQSSISIEMCFTESVIFSLSFIQCMISWCTDTDWRFNHVTSEARKRGSFCLKRNCSHLDDCRITVTNKVRYAKRPWQWASLNVLTHQGSYELSGKPRAGAVVVLFLSLDLPNVSSQNNARINVFHEV